MASEKRSDNNGSHHDDDEVRQSRQKPSSLPVKSRRKISMPWFRQSSFGMSLARLRLPKQHTIATELLNDDGPKETIPEVVPPIGKDTTWVTSDYLSPGPGELAVNRGQQVEILDYPSDPASQAMVRLINRTTTPTSGETTPTTIEGLLPASCLKLPPGGLRPPSANNEDEYSGEAQPGSSSGTGSSSPVSKKKGFSGKWLPNIRKLSQGKLDKTSGSGQAALFQKQTSRNKFKLSQSTPSTSETMGNKLGHASDVGAEDKGKSGHTANGEDTDDPVPVVEVQPAVQPISLIPVASSTSTNNLDQKGEGWMPNPADLNASGHTVNDETSAALDPAEVEKAIEQRSYRLQELLESERVYIGDLEQCCQYIKYMKETKDAEDPEIAMPEGLKDGKDRMIFGNIEAIYEWHRDFFLKNLTKSMENPVELGNLFKRYDRKFQMYVVYCQNKPKSEFIVSEYIDNYFEEIRLKLGFKLRLTDLLIKPIQRLTKYHMLLEAILKYSQRAGLTEEAAALSCAFHVMTVVPNQANEMMDIGRLQGFEGKITAQGKLLHKGPLNALDTFSSPPQNGPPKMKPFTCFLFEQIMIFSETVGKKTQFTSPVYVYKAHFLVNKMALDEKCDDGDPLKFLIKSNDPARDETRIVCQAEDFESKNQWLTIMKRQLQTQMDFLRALQAPIAYHNKLAKEAASYSDMSHLWEVVDVATSNLKALNANRPRSNPNNFLQDGIDLASKTMSLPSSPVVKDQPGKLDHKPKPYPPTLDRKLSASMLERSGSGSGNVSRSVTAKMQFLEGFRQTLRPRTKSDDFSEEAAELKQELDLGKIAPKQGVSSVKPNLETSLSSSGAIPAPEKIGTGLIRRWSETTSSAKNSGEQSDLESISSVITPGSSVKVLVDYRPVKEDEVGVARGEMVQVLETSQSRGYRIKRLNSSSNAEGWVPIHVLNLLTNGPRRPGWTFKKFRKPSFNTRKDSSGKLSTITDIAELNSANKPDLSSKTITTSEITSERVRRGDPATLTCSIPLSMNHMVTSGEAHILWKTPVGNTVRPGNKYSTRIVTTEDQGVSLKSSTLALVNCTELDAGSYTCSVVVGSTNEVLFSASKQLQILPVPIAPGSPRVQDLRGPTALVVWDKKDTASESGNRLYTVEMKRLRAAQWTTAWSKIVEQQCNVGELIPGECYSFRVAVQIGEDGELSEFSSPSSPLSIPLDDPIPASLNLQATTHRRGCNFTNLSSSSNLENTWQKDFERHYIELEELGRGRFSVVRRCQEILSGNEVAVKFVNRRKQNCEETQKEFKILSVLKHPNIVSGSGIFLTATSDAIVMDLVNGTPLFEHFCEDTSYSELSVCTFMEQVLEGLAYLHDQKIIHLDLKPENLMLDKKENIVRLIDLGSAQEMNVKPADNLSRAKYDVSPEFLPPEVISNGPVGTYTDMWAFGVLLFVSLSGLSPFLGQSDDETGRKILRCDFHFPAEQFLTISNEAKDLIGKILQVNPDQRLSASGCLQSPWLKNNNLWEQRSKSLISSNHLCTLVRRRMKTLSSVVPVQMTRLRLQRP